MKFEWFGASHFLITTEKGVRIAMDPFQYNIIVEGQELPPGGNAIRPTYNGEADVITMSHGHFDHSYLWGVQGLPRLYTGGKPQEYKGVNFMGVTAYHGINGGDYNTFVGFEADGLRVWHTGDHGPVLTREQLEDIGRVDILMTNWDNDPHQMNFETLDIVLNQLKPKVIFPMHHVLVTEFMTNRKGFIDHRLDNVTEVEFKADSLPPAEMTVILIKPSLGNPINFFSEEQ